MVKPTVQEIRALIIDDEFRAKVTKLLEYAKQFPYKEGDPVPGHNPNYVMKVSTYRVVFTFTHTDGRIYRHMSISIPRKNFYPHPIAVFTIAAELGFTGWTPEMGEKLPDDWVADVNKGDNCIILAQEVPCTERIQ